VWIGFEFILIAHSTLYVESNHHSFDNILYIFIMEATLCVLIRWW